jgi:hypothetical protein
MMNKINSNNETINSNVTNNSTIQQKANNTTNITNNSTLQKNNNNYNTSKLSISNKRTDLSSNQENDSYLKNNHN